MKWLKGLFWAVVVLAIALVVIGFLIPDHARVERSATIEAPPATVYTVLDGFHQFNRWSPWADLDPNTIYVYAGPVAGVGAFSSWSSADANVGSGSQKILEATPYSSIKLRLRFEGMDVDNLVTYTLVPENAGKATRLTWSYDSDFEGNLLNRYFGLILDRMIGPDFDKGLSRLKSFAESLPKDDFTSIRPEVVEVKAQPIAYISTEAPLDEAAPVIAAAYARIGQFLEAVGRSSVGAPITVTRDFDPETRFWKFDAALPIDQACTPPSEADDIRCGAGDAGWVVRAEHLGPYASLDRSWSTLSVFKTVAGLADNGATWEQYVGKPGDASPEASKTMLYAPVK